MHHGHKMSRGDQNHHQQQMMQQQQQQQFAQQQQQQQYYSGFPQQQPPQQQQPQKANAASRTSATTMSQMTGSKFAELNIHPLTKKALAEVLKYETMTIVQQQSCPVALTGVDLLAKAKTGTGKTLSFLIPAVENVLRAPQLSRLISVLVISPTRELAQQIEEEAKMLVKCHNGAITVMCIVGGTNMNRDINGFKNPPSILVATPGRLNDHLENGKLSQILSSLRCLIFDEADQLLDMGFRPAILTMLKHLPPKNTRQTLLFSATMPADVKTIADIAMRSADFTYIDTVGEEENTHQHVEQTYVIATKQGLAPELVQLVREGMQTPGFKIIAFFPTARQTQLYAELLNELGIRVLEIHSRKSQSQRNKVSEEFRVGSGLIMFTSDVSARGMDYPDVSRVIQCGAPSDRAQYVHRLGRTARAGKDGSGVLLLCDFEQWFLREVKDLPMKRRNCMPDQVSQQMLPAISQAFTRLPDATISSSYQAWMGFYNSFLRKLGWSKEDLVMQANDWVMGTLGRHEPPEMEKKTIGKMGLKGVPGLNIASGDGGGGGRGGGFGGGGFGGGGGRGGGRGGARGGRGGGRAGY